MLKYRYIIITLISIIFYGASLSYDFCTDDEYYIVKNSNADKGIEGIKNNWSKGSLYGYENFEGEGLYRPLSTSYFTVITSIFGKNPLIFHFGSIVLYTLLMILIFKVLETFLTVDQNILTWYLLFVINPLHIEVVANIKSVEVLLMSLFLFLGLYMTLKEKFLYGFIFSLLSLLSKETGVISFLLNGLIILQLKDYKIKSVLRHFLFPLLLMTLYFIIRKSIVGYDNVQASSNGLLQFEFGSIEYYFNAMYLQLVYIYKYFIPTNLLWYYSSGHFLFNKLTAALGLLFIVVVILVIKSVLKQPKRKDLLIFSVLFLGTTLLFGSFIFPNGTMFADRFYFLQTLSLTFYIYYIAKITFKKHEYIFQFLLPLIFLGIYSYTTFKELPDWKNNEAAIKDINENSNGYYAKSSIGIKLYNEGKNLELLQLLDDYTGVEISSLESLKGFANYNLKNYNVAIKHFEKAHSLQADSKLDRNIYAYWVKSLIIVNPTYKDTNLINVGIKYKPSSFAFTTKGEILFNNLKYKEAESAYLKADSLNNFSNGEDKAHNLFALGYTEMILGKHIEGVNYLKESIFYKPTFKAYYAIAKYNYFEGDYLSVVNIIDSTDHLINNKTPKTILDEYKNLYHDSKKLLIK